MLTIFLQWAHCFWSLLFRSWCALRVSCVSLFTLKQNQTAEVVTHTVIEERRQAWISIYNNCVQASWLQSRRKALLCWLRAGVFHSSALNGLFHTHRIVLLVEWGVTVLVATPVQFWWTSQMASWLLLLETFFGVGQSSLSICPFYLSVT